MNLRTGRMAAGPLAVVVSLLLASGPARAAGSDTDTITVTATVNEDCSITTNALAFGVYDSLANSPSDASTTLDVQCTSGTSYDVLLDAGAGSGATVATREMTAGANTLNYTLYQDAGRTTVWGDSNPNKVSGTGTGSTQALTVYGRVFASQAAAPGSYSDTVVATVSW